MRIRSQLAILVVAVMAPVAVLAGFALERLEAGFDAFLIKPFERSKFEAAARMAATKER